jgi:hypothetical protein
VGVGVGVGACAGAGVGVGVQALVVCWPAEPHGLVQACHDGWLSPPLHSSLA